MQVHFSLSDRTGGFNCPPRDHARLTGSCSCRSNATNAAAARYLASLQLNGASDFASSRVPAQFMIQQQQQQQVNQATQNTQKVAIQRLTAVQQDARPFGGRSDGSVPFVATRAYPQPAQPAYPPNTAFSQLRPAAADSRAHMHLQFGNTISPMKGSFLPTVHQLFSSSIIEAVECTCACHHTSASDDLQSITCCCGVLENNAPGFPAN